MKKGKYKKIKNHNPIKNILILFALAVVLIVVNLVLTSSISNNNENNENLSIKNTSIKQIIEKYGCTYIKEKNVKKADISKHIYLKFKYKPFEGDESKEEFYLGLLTELTKFINGNYRLIDENNNVTVDVKKKTESIEDEKYIYAINGESDYFKKEESRITLKNYKEDKQTTFQINSSILNDLVKNNWSSSIIQDKPDSSYNKYDIFSNKGIEVRTINRKIYCIEFTNKYKEAVVNGILPGMAFSEIIKILGTPIYETENYIGYKSDNIYVFFNSESISVYANQETNVEEFEELLNKYIEKEINIKTFMNELTYLWPDYEEYNYGSKSIYLNYPNKGLRIYMKSETSLGIQICKNYNITEKTRKLVNDGKILADMSEDLVNYTHKEKLEKLNQYKQKAIEIEQQNEDNNFKMGISNLYYLYYEASEEIITKCLFISKVNGVNRQIYENINQIVFVDDVNVVFSVKNDGIYLFNLNTGKKDNLVKGEGDYKISSLDNGILKYDNNQIKIY